MRRCINRGYKQYMEVKDLGCCICIGSSASSLVAVTKLTLWLIPRDVLLPCPDCSGPARTEGYFPCGSSDSLVFQLNACLSVTSKSFGYSATLTDAAYYSSPLFLWFL